MNEITLTDRGRALLRTFRAAFEALTEHGKEHAHEQLLIVEAVAAHLRSAWPMVATAAAAPAPLDTGPVLRAPTDTVVHIDLGDGAFVELDQGEDDKLSLYVHSDNGREAGVELVREKAVEIHARLTDSLAMGAR